VPNLTFQKRQELILGIDSDVDNDTDEGEEESAVGESSVLSIGSEPADLITQMLNEHESMEIESIEIEDDEENAGDEDKDEDFDNYSY